MRLFEVRYKFEDNGGHSQDISIFGPSTLKTAIAWKRDRCELISGGIAEYEADHLHVEQLSIGDLSI